MRAWVRAAASSMRSFGNAVADGLRHAAVLGDLGDVGTGPLRQPIGQPLHVVGARPGIDRPGGAGLLLQHQLGVAGDPGGEVGGQRQRLVERVGVQRLGVALGRGHRLDAGAGDVVESVLSGQRPSRGLRMCAQRQRFGALRVELGDQLAPQQPAGTQLGDLHEEVHPDAPEEGQPGRELVDVQLGVQPRLDVVDAVGQRVGQLQIRCGTGFLDVIAGDRDRVELRHLRAAVAEDVGDDPHRRLGRIDVGVADHELFEDVVLDGAGQLLRRHPLLLGGHHVQRQDRQHRTVHGHRHRHRRQIDAVEQLPHVQDGIDCHTGHSDVALHAGMVGVVAAVGGQVEGHRQPLLAGGEVAAVERVGLRGGGEPGVLTDGPRLVDIHRRVGAAHEGRLAGEAVQRVTVGLDGGTVRGDVYRFDVDVFRCVPHQLVRGIPVRGSGRRDMFLYCVFSRRGHGPFAVQRDVGEAADNRRGGRHRRYAPNRLSRLERASTALIFAVRNSSGWCLGSASAAPSSAFGAPARQT